MISKSATKAQQNHNHQEHHDHHAHHQHHDQHVHHHAHHQQNLNWKFWVKIIFFMVLYGYFVVINIGQFPGAIKWTWHFGIWFPITTYVVFWEGRVYLKAWKNIFKGRFDMDTLIALGAHICYLYSIVIAILNFSSPMYSYDQIWEVSGILIIFTNIGHGLEGKVEKSSSLAFKKLNHLKHAKIEVLREKEVLILPASQLEIGDIITIKKGDIVPSDGILLTRAILDLSNITGESKPQILKKGQEAISGAFNIDNIIKIKISRSAQDSTLSKIIEKVKEVAKQRPPMQKFADRFLQYFVPIVMIISFLTFLTYLIIGLTVGNVNFPWVHESDPWTLAIKAGVTVLAISCPCALGIATPLVYAVSSFLSAKKGIMINDPKALEELSRVKIFAFDKTGTITNEVMEIVEVVGDQKLIPIAKSLEKDVNHPIAKSIMQLPGEIAKVSNIKVENQMITGIWKGLNVKIARHDTNNITTDIALSIDNQVKLTFSMQNSIKEGVASTISNLKKAGFKVVMITGDRKEVAQDVANRVGIENVYANVTPQGKTAIIKQLSEEGKILFVGDGFNDSIAAKQASVSVAFASGSEITNSLADISILNNQFNTILDLINLSKYNNLEVKISLFYAFAFNIIAIPLAVFLFVQPWLGAAIMSLSDIIVASNAFIYRTWGAKKLNIKIRDAKFKV